ncbi:zinc knuckle family protein [Moniliophthora roreri MCA 2997]|uniref:Zinc knuckle family protein n=1 Tax=Moniliophthora roreri (strain MCA 2997) TaxID=1381753 RepID=V2XGT1_MONRO|nr:zinc knuckle family protein [Moniliophthora roreri MCA 2997]
MLDFCLKPPSRTSRKPPSAASPRRPCQTLPAAGSKQCYCDKPATQKEVTGNSNSRGKLYWGCSSSSCQLFEWVNPPSSDNSSPSGARTAAIAQALSAQTSDREPPQCDCGIPAGQRTVTKENENKGRQFWTCGDDRKCNFFRFVDDPDLKVPAKRTFSTSNAGSSARGGTSGACYKCNQEGHWANACPNAASETSSRSRNFGSSASTQNNAGPSSRGGTSGTCYKCNQEGHWANACPNAETTNQTRSFGGSAANLPGKSASSKSICHKCNQSGHFSSKCPNVSDSKPTKGRGSGRGRGSRGGGRGKGRGKTTAQTKSGFSIPAGFDY